MRTTLGITSVFKKINLLFWKKIFNVVYEKTLKPFWPSKRRRFCIILEDIFRYPKKTFWPGLFDLWDRPFKLLWSSIRRLSGLDNFFFHAKILWVFKRKHLFYEKHLQSFLGLLAFYEKTMLTFTFCSSIRNPAAFFKKHFGVLWKVLFGFNGETFWEKKKCRHL